MMIEFKIENFRSIKKEVVFSMLATKDKLLDNNLIQNALKEDALLKSAVIYGANASGKTNVLLALNFLKMIVIKSHKHQKGQGIRFVPFKLDKKYLKKPTKFQIVFLKNKVKYGYSVSFDEKKIIDESLYHYPNNKKALVFERKNTAEFKFTIEQKEQKAIAKRTLENVLYISKSVQENFNLTLPAFEWFRNDLQFIGPYDPGLSEEFTISILNKNEKLKKLVLKALLAADLGIEDISAVVKKVEGLPAGMPPELKALIAKKGGLKESRIKTVHKGIEFEFYAEESEGTKRMFSLIGPWIDALENGKILVIDELDTKLHHTLNMFLVNLFHDLTQNKTNAQLIVTTHNTNLLDQNIFRRDQIWFTEKDSKTGATDLYSLSEYHQRKDKDIERGYLAGKYGALPFIKESRIF